MKTKFLFVLVFITQLTVAQKNWFTTYKDSVALLKDASQISNQFIITANKIFPNSNFKPKVILNTTPYLIYYDAELNTVNLPFWDKVLPELKQFTVEVTGSEEEGKKMFGLFFNGFYLTHELAHALQYALLPEESQVSYANEFLANQITMMYWKKIGKQKELKQCYVFAKKMFAKLPNPIPEGQTKEVFFTKNYIEATKNPFVYAYMQFGQFIEIYESKTVLSYDDFLKSKLQKPE